VTPNKIELELSQSIVRDANVGQFAKTRADAVNDVVARNDIFDDSTRSNDTGACGRGDLHGRISERYRGDLGKRQLLAVQFHPQILIRTQQNMK
jgi:hypothetical protein